MKLEIELKECDNCFGSGHNEYRDDDYRDHFVENGCNNCGGVGHIAYTKINDKKCKLKLEVQNEDDIN